MARESNLFCLAWFLTKLIFTWVSSFLSASSLPLGGTFEYLIIYQGHFPVAFPSDFTSRKYRTNSQPEAITAPIVAIQRNVNLHIKMCLYTHVSGFGFCICYYNFKDYLVYFLQGKSLTCPLRPGFLLLPAHVKKMPFYICRKQVVVVITIPALWNLSKVIGLRIPLL